MRAVLVALALLAAGPARAEGDARRRETLENLQRQLPKSDAFDKWLQDTGALPPDLARMPAEPFLPDLVRGVSRGGWGGRRAELASLVERWLVGRAPPAPAKVTAEITAKSAEGKDRETWRVALRFGPKDAALLRCQLVKPRDADKSARPARLPVLLTDNRKYMAWAERAMEHGFLFVHCDARDPSFGHDDTAEWTRHYAQADWSALRRRAWGMSRAVDWLSQLEFVDRKRIFVGGHARSAKQALVAAAFDPRVAGVIVSSAGAGASIPFRYADESVLAESTELLTRRFPDWLKRELRFWSGREDRLPADTHMLYALVAPRPLLVSVGTEDWSENTWAVEQSFASAQRVYRLLGEEDQLALRYRAGQQNTDDETHRAFSVFLMSAARMDPRPPAQIFRFTPLHPWDYDAWLRAAGDLAPPPGETPLGPRVDWLLGEGQRYEPKPVRWGEGEDEGQAKTMARNVVKSARRERVRFGGGINGTLYLPELPEGERAPCIVWLPPLHTATGFVAPYYRSGEIPMTTLVAAGFAVLSFDPIGTGGRKHERREFFTKHPRWSLMGKMVLDARHALDAAASAPSVDANRVYLFGYALGGQVALFTAAVDKRVKGLAVVAGFTPMATDGPRRPTGGIRRWSHLWATMPRLGPLVNNPERVPVDYPEILASLAPRPALVVAPRDDRHANHLDVIAAVQTARAVYGRAGASAALVLEAPDDWNRLTDPVLARVVGFFQRLSPRKDAATSKAP